MSSFTQRRCHSHRAEHPYGQGGNSNFLEERGERWPGSYFSHITRVRRVSRGVQRKVVICCVILTPHQLTQTGTKSHFYT